MTTHTNVFCDVCNVNPIVGIRWRCLRCMNYDLCQACFDKKNHEPSHPMIYLSEEISDFNLRTWCYSYARRHQVHISGNYFGDIEDNGIEEGVEAPQPSMEWYLERGKKNRSEKEGNNKNTLQE